MILASMSMSGHYHRDCVCVKTQFLTSGGQAVVPGLWEAPVPLSSWNALELALFVPRGVRT